MALWRWLRPKHGQALVEFALVLPLLLLLLVGIVEFGRLASDLVLLRGGTYDLLRVTAVGTADADSAARGAQLAGHVVDAAAVYSAGYEGADYVVVYSDDGDDEWVKLRFTPGLPGRHTGDTITAEVVYSFRPIFVGWLLPRQTFTIVSVGRAEYPPD